MGERDQFRMVTREPGGVPLPAVYVAALETMDRSNKRAAEAMNRARSLDPGSRPLAALAAIDAADAVLAAVAEEAAWWPARITEIFAPALLAEVERARAGWARCRRRIVADLAEHRGTPAGPLEEGE
jgi:hypothetical protein